MKYKELISAGWIRICYYCDYEIMVKEKEMIIFDKDRDEIVVTRTTISYFFVD